VDRTQLKKAAAEYPYLRGLFLLPLGGLFVASALGNWGYDWVFLAMLPLAALAALLVNRYYDEHWGRVTPSARTQLKATIAGGVGAAVMLGLTTLLRSRASWSLDLPVNPIPAAFAVLMLAYYALVARLRAHHLVIWGGLLVLSLLPVWDGDDPANVGLVLCGVAVMVDGVLDHLVLVRTLGPARG
jgi:heme O synthase-like polyprenyltransferase